MSGVSAPRRRDGGRKRKRKSVSLCYRGEQRHPPRSRDPTLRSVPGVLAGGTKATGLLAEQLLPGRGEVT